MTQKLNMAAYRRNVRKACAASGIPKGYSTSIASNGDFIVYSAQYDIVGRLTEWEEF